MPTNLPRKLPELFNWCQTHSDQWQENFAAIGLSNTQANLFRDSVEAMLTANTAAQTARQASKDATMDFQGAVEDARSIAGGFIATIKSFAEVTNNSSVYALAGITPDDEPGVVPPPLPPSEFSASINPDGSLNIAFKAAQPKGVTSVVYQIFRRVNTLSGPFEQIGSTGKLKRYTDVTLPFGVDRVDYMVRPERGGVMGAQSAVFSVQFGSVSGGGAGSLSINRTMVTPHDVPMRVAA